MFRALTYALIPLASGCATYSDSFVTIESNLAAQQPALALLSLEKQTHASRDRVVYLLNKGMLLRMDGQFKRSNEVLEAAKQRMEKLYGISLREQAMSFIINDGTRSYAGEEYEQVLVHLYEALNYLEMGQIDEARVEALQADLRMRQLAQKLPEKAHTEDAFTRYLTGIIYEDLGEWSDAMIAYRKAYEAYLQYEKRYALPVPGFLKIDLLRHAQRQGLTEELKKYKRLFGRQKWKEAPTFSENGEVVFMLHNGLAPIKREHSITAIDPASGHLFRISVPYYESRPVTAVGVRLTVGDKTVPSEIFEDIDAIARRNLEAKMPAITARALARTVLKAQVAKTARDDNNPLAGLLLDVAGVVTERADTRSWLTLPRNIHVGRLSLPPGSYRIKVELLGRLNKVITVWDYPDIVVRKQRKTFVSRHWISPSISGVAR
jgi:hypothetical protein